MSNLAAVGQEAIAVDIGDIPISLFSNSAGFLALVHDRYSGFLCPAPQALLELSVDVLPRTDPREEDIRVTLDSGKWSVSRGDFNLEWDPYRNSGTLQLGMNAYSLDAALRVLHTLLLAKKGGFLLHAASAVCENRSFLFFGPSGSGKTTLARLAPAEARLLTDEISYVCPRGANYLAYGTPFTGELGKSGENISAPIGALYHLVQAPANRITPMKPADAARALLESVLFFAEEPNLVKLVFRSVCDLVACVPVYRLEFVPNQSVWNLIQ
jgi:hypothetical protein